MRFLTVTCALASGTMLWAQCMQPQYYEVNCQAPSCNQNVIVTIPYSVEYGLTMQAGYVACCDKNIESYYVVSGCQTAQMRDPKIRKTLFAALNGQPLLVADCKGQYSPLLAPHPTITQSQSGSSVSSVQPHTAAIGAIGQ